MSLSLPASDSSLRELFDIRADLVPLGTPEGRANCPTFVQATIAARRMFDADKSVRAVHSVCVRATGELWLVKFGPRGGWSKLWNFGKL